LASLDVGYAPVNTLLEAMSDPHVVARELLLRDESGRRHLAPPIRFAGDPARPSLREPSLGEHTAEVMAALDAAEEPE
jgi:crotonobetainyl-CoA:carnitine CoA-transferase CaiB-like acyl-CoA transferase